MFHLVGAAAYGYMALTGNERTLVGRSSETNIERYARYLRSFNMGFMRSLQSNPDDLETKCVEKTKQTNVKIEAMFKDANYSTGKINQAEFLQFVQISSIALMDQFESCGTNNFLMIFDSGLNQLPSTIGSLVSTGTMAGTGWEKRDSAIFIAYDGLINGWNTVDWEKIGMSTSLLLSQILKYEAPNATVPVSPTSA